MKKLLSILIIFFAITTANAQSITINKPLKDFSDTFNLSTPLNTGVTCSYLIVNGKRNLWRDVSAYSIKEYFPKAKQPDKAPGKAYKEYMLNSIIKEVIIFKDSVACMITQIDSSNYSIRMMGFEDGKWLNIGENLGRGIEDARKVFHTKAPNVLDRLRYSVKVKSIPTDTSAFVNYIKKSGMEPKKFFLEALTTYPLVIYGELHRRKVSWDFLISLLHEPNFVEEVGTIFVELPAYQQSEFDRFYTSKELDTEIVLDILRSEQIYGMWDKGEYELLIEIWKLNKTLPNNKKIKVIAVDEQLPYNLIKTTEEYKREEALLNDRNTQMADVIEQNIKTKTDKRNSLFIVGYAHAYKSHVPGMASAARGKEPALTAGAQLVQRLSEKNVFIILQHVPMGTNSGALGLLRQGLFDATFEKNGNKPVAFSLAGSPFGAEPFDADYHMSFDSRTGTFANNYDGYVFFNPLKDEEPEYILYDIWSDKFVNEIKRRAAITNFNINRWLGVKGEITKEEIISAFKKYSEGKKRWSNLFE